MSMRQDIQAVLALAGLGQARNCPAGYEDRWGKSNLVCPPPGAPTKTELRSDRGCQACVEPAGAAAPAGGAACPAGYLPGAQWQQFGGGYACTNGPLQQHPTRPECYACPDNPPPVCIAPFSWQRTCDAGHPKSITTPDGCNACLRDNNTPCPAGYGKPPAGWVFGGCPRGYSLDINDITGCVGCVSNKCPSPYVKGPQVCQTGWQSVHHPQYPDCVVCAPIPPLLVGTPPNPAPASAPSPGPAPAAAAPTTAGLSTGAMVGIGVAALVFFGLVAAGRKS